MIFLRQGHTQESHRPRRGVWFEFRPDTTRSISLAVVIHSTIHHHHHRQLTEPATKLTKLTHLPTKLATHHHNSQQTTTFKARWRCERARIEHRTRTDWLIKGQKVAYLNHSGHATRLFLGDGQLHRLRSGCTQPPVSRSLFHWWTNSTFWRFTHRPWPPASLLESIESPRWRSFRGG